MRPAATTASIWGSANDARGFVAPDAVPVATRTTAVSTAAWRRRMALISAAKPRSQSFRRCELRRSCPESRATVATCGRWHSSSQPPLLRRWPPPVAPAETTRPSPRRPSAKPQRLRSPAGLRRRRSRASRSKATRSRWTTSAAGRCSSTSGRRGEARARARRSPTQTSRRPIRRSSTSASTSRTRLTKDATSSIATSGRGRRSRIPSESARDGSAPTTSRISSSSTRMAASSTPGRAAVTTPSGRRCSQGSRRAQQR
jgi:hypothetical protein